MEESKRVEAKRKRKGNDPMGSARGKKRRTFPFDHKLRAVKFYLEEQYPAKVVCQEMGMSNSSLITWVHEYRERGEEGLKPKYGRHHQSRMHSSVKDKIIEIKKQTPKFGVKRISQMLKRIFFLKASAETVRRTLHDVSLMDKPKKKRQKNITRPRFFQRSTPNQLWQTDIFTFRLGGKNAYLIGYIDDYSRYITGMGLFRSQTAEHVLEIFRSGAAEYNPPKEMLTDNGRQYTNWRGKTRFEGEMQKEKIKHIKSRPHHPMTLGKIERFWKTIFGEFLSRAQFLSFEEARERLTLWIRYYNHRRPHQGIGGLCPADRYFEVHHALKKTMEHGIEENILEMALRGKPKDPFYMVGRMEGQSVVIRAEKGKVKMHIEGEEDNGKNKELEYNIKGKEKEDIQDAQAQRDGKMPGNTLDMDREEKACGCVPGDGYQLDDLEPVAKPGTGGDDAGALSAGEPGELSIPQSKATCTACKERKTDAKDTGKSHEPEPGQTAYEDIGICEERRERSVDGEDEQRSTCSQTSSRDLESAERSDDGDERSKGTGHIAKKLLCVGAPGAESAHGRSYGTPFRASPAGGARSGGEEERGKDPDPGAGERDPSSTCGDPAVDDGNAVRE